MPEPIGSWITNVASIFKSLFQDLAFLEPMGPKLDITVTPKPYKSIRFELDASQFLHLHSVELFDDKNNLVCASNVTIEASSHYGDSAKYTREKLFLDPSHSKNYGIHTQKDREPWIEISFSSEIPLQRILVRNRENGPTARAAGILIRASRDEATWDTLYNGKDRIQEFLAKVDAEYLAAKLPQDTQKSIVQVVTDTFIGNYQRARKIYFSDALSETLRNNIRDGLNKSVLNPRQLEWTTHGAQRSFRFWSDKQKKEYIQLAASVIEDLKCLSSDVCFGFGSVLGMVRDNNLIDHDDDMDIIIAFTRAQARTIAAARTLTKKHLEERGYTVEGKFFAHWHVKKKKQKVDVFVGLYDADMKIGWYPAKRGNLDRKDLFPAKTINFYGIICRIPADPEEYLSAIYGPNWQSKDPGWEHPWDRSSYLDIA